MAAGSGRRFRPRFPVTPRSPLPIPAPAIWLGFSAGFRNVSASKSPPLSQPPELGRRPSPALVHEEAAGRGRQGRVSKRRQERARYSLDVLATAPRTF